MELHERILAVFGFAWCLALAIANAITVGRDGGGTPAFCVVITSLIAGAMLPLVQDALTLQDRR